MRSAWILSILATTNLWWRRVSKPGRYVHRDDVYQKQTFKTENGARRWLERNSGEWYDFDTIMEKAYEEYFEGLADGKKLSASTNLNRRFPVRQNLRLISETAPRGISMQKREPVISRQTIPMMNFMSGCARKLMHAGSEMGQWSQG